MRSARHSGWHAPRLAWWLARLMSTHMRVPCQTHHDVPAIPCRNLPHRYMSQPATPLHVATCHTITCRNLPYQHILQSAICKLPYHCMLQPALGTSSS
eukprot:174497-Chlamydomonas_euryale.AAC.6